jgi:hypothetical protein
MHSGIPSPWRPGGHGLSGVFVAPQTAGALLAPAEPMV